MNCEFVAGEVEVDQLREGVYSFWEGFQVVAAEVEVGQGCVVSNDARNLSMGNFI